MKLRWVLIAIGLAVPSGASAANPPTCPFKYSPTVRHEIIDPFVTKIAGRATEQYDTRDISAIKEDMNVRIQVFRPRSIDGDEIQILLDPCTNKIINGGIEPAFPDITGVRR